MSKAIVTVKKDNSSYTLENVVNVVFAEGRLLVTWLNPDEGGKPTSTYTPDHVYVVIA